MTTTQLTDLELLAHDEWNISSSCREAVKAIIAERATVISHCKSMAHLGVNAASHDFALRVLEILKESK